jgi:hypothetical protein
MAHTPTADTPAGAPTQGLVDLVAAFTAEADIAEVADSTELAGKSRNQTF